MDLYKVAKMQQVWVRDIAICSEKPSPAKPIMLTKNTLTQTVAH